MDEWINDPRNGSFPYTMNAFQTYDLYVEWYEYIINAHAILYWRYGAVPDTIIPDANYGYAQDVALSPYQVEFINTCQTGYTPGDAVITVCVLN